MRPIMLDLFCGAGGVGKGYDAAGFEVVGVDIAPQPNYPFRFVQADAMELLERMLDERAKAVRRGSGGGRHWQGGVQVEADNRTSSGEDRGRPRDQPQLGEVHDADRLLRLTDFDVVHASPPCQLDCGYRRRGAGVGDGYADLIAPVRDLLIATGLPYVIENVEGAAHKMRNPIRLCGSSFGLDVRRHRLFESNVPMLAPPCDHSWQTPRFPQATNRTNLRSTVEVGVWRIPLDVQQAAMGIGWMTLPELTLAIPPAMTEHVGGFLMAEVRSRQAVAA